MKYLVDKLEYGRTMEVAGHWEASECGAFGGISFVWEQEIPDGFMPGGLCDPLNPIHEMEWGKFGYKDDADFFEGIPEEVPDEILERLARIPAAVEAAMRRIAAETVAVVCQGRHIGIIPPSLVEDCE